MHQPGQAQNKQRTVLVSKQTRKGQTRYRFNPRCHIGDRSAHNTTLRDAKFSHPVKLHCSTNVQRRHDAFIVVRGLAPASPVHTVYVFLGLDAHNYADSADTVRYILYVLCAWLYGSENLELQWCAYLEASKGKTETLRPLPGKTRAMPKHQFCWSRNSEEKQKLENNRAETLGQWSRSSKDTAMQNAKAETLNYCTASEQRCRNICARCRAIEGNA